VLDQTRESDYTIWLIALLLYVFDAGRLLTPREMLLVEAGRGRLTAAALGENPLTLFGRVLVFAPLLRPDRGVFPAAWGRAWLDPAGFEKVLRALEQARSSLLIPRILAGCGFVLLFGLGPILTLFLGPNAAVAFTALLLYPSVAAAIAWVWWNRRRIALTVPHAAWLSVEILVCPAFLPNLVRKLTARHPVAADGAQLLAATAPEDEKAETLARLAARAEEAIEADSGESAERTALREYLDRIRDIH